MTTRNKQILLIKLRIPYDILSVFYLLKKVTTAKELFLSAHRTYELTSLSVTILLD